MSKIVSIISSPEIPIDQPFVHACWILSHNAFWCNDCLPAAEVIHAKKAIQELLTEPAMDRNVIRFTELLLISYKTVRMDSSRWIDLPSLWFNPLFPDGISSQEDKYNTIREKRKIISGYYKGIRIFAVHFLRYIKSPSNKTVKSCYTKLLSLREYDLIQLWNNVIVHLLMSRKRN